MKNLYNKIYKAINEGIQKALILPTDQDVSINYSYHKIDNNIDKNIQTILDEKVKELIKKSKVFKPDNVQELLNEIILYSNHGKYLYTPENYQEIDQIFRVIISNINSDISAVDYDDIFWVDLSNFVTLIKNDGSEISIMNINNQNKKDIRFIKLKNNICEHDIILSSSLKYKPEKYWNINYIKMEDFDYFAKLLGKDPNDENTQEILDNIHLINHTDYNNEYCIYDQRTALTDYYGYENTYDNLNIKYKKYKNELMPYALYPAFLYCVQQSQDNYKGYLPAIGELNFIRENNALINYILRYINDDYQYYFEICGGCWWSSTENSMGYAWYIDTDYMNDVDKPRKGEKTDCKYLILPLFKKIN